MSLKCIVFLYVIKYIIVNDCFCHLCGFILTLKNSGGDNNKYIIGENNELCVRPAVLESKLSLMAYLSVQSFTPWQTLS